MLRIAFHLFCNSGRNTYIKGDNMCINMWSNSGIPSLYFLEGGYIFSCRRNKHSTRRVFATEIFGNGKLWIIPVKASLDTFKIVSTEDVELRNLNIAIVLRTSLECIRYIALNSWYSEHISFCGGLMIFQQQNALWNLQIWNCTVEKL